jgi:hypothetical protein
VLCIFSLFHFSLCSRWTVVYHFREIIENYIRDICISLITSYTEHFFSFVCHSLVKLFAHFISIWLYLFILL